VQALVDAGADKDAKDRVSESVRKIYLHVVERGARARKERRCGGGTCGFFKLAVYRRSPTCSLLLPSHSSTHLFHSFVL
jgi:hypothetical protein